MSAAEQLQKILSELEDDSIAENLTMDDLVRMRKEINPYGRIIEGSDKYLTFSYTDLREKYLTRLITTSMVGYLNRCVAEWRVPEGIPPVHPYDYAQNKELLPDPATYRDPKARRDAKENLEIMEERIIVQRFLESVFQFDPDEHIRSSYRPAPEDPDRKTLETPAAKRAVWHLRKTDKKFNEKMEKFEARQKLASQISADVAGKGDSKTSSQTQDHIAEMIPPDDTFGNFRRYMEVNYDMLREAVNDLYCEKPDLDRAICPHAWHDSRDEADTYMRKHSNEMIAEVHVAHSGKWNFFAPLGKVRETAKYFNSHTVVLEEMVKQIELDAKLGQDLMKKKIVKKKQKNIEEEGPDAEGFAAWKAQNSTLKDMGALEVKNENSYASEDCPENAVEVAVFSFSEGGKKIKKSKFFTEAEAPTRPDEEPKNDQPGSTDKMPGDQKERKSHRRKKSAKASARKN